MWTTSFAQIALLPDGIKPIGLSHTPPLWYKGVTYSLLAPSHELLWSYRKKLMDASECAHWYQKETLDVLNPHVVYNELSFIGNYDPALCCYNTPEESLCIRRLVAGWLSFATGHSIPELTFPIKQ